MKRGTPSRSRGSISAPRALFLALLILALAGCQGAPPDPQAPVASVNPSPGAPPTARPTAAPATATLQPSPTPPPPSPTATPVLIQAAAGQPFGQAVLSRAQAASYPAGADALPLDLRAVRNPEVIEGLSGAERAFLAQNGFVVITGRDESFKAIRRSVSTVSGQPYYLTTDAAFHALRVTVNNLQAGVESEILLPELIDLTAALYEQAGVYARESSGTELGPDAQRAQDYLGVARKLFEPGLSLEAGVEGRIAAQMEQIRQGQGTQASALIPRLEDDYAAYKPGGHYAASPALESYYRGSRWLEQAGLGLDESSGRTALVLTLALREAQADKQPARELWASIRGTLDFLEGQSADAGPAELDRLLNEVYGPGYGLRALADGARWQALLGRVKALNPAAGGLLDGLRLADGASAEWRLLGRRTAPGERILAQLTAPQVSARALPNGLDLAAALGSQAALAALVQAGETQAQGYTDRMEALRSAVQGLSEAAWLDQIPGIWLYAYQAQTAGAGDADPPAQRSRAWGYKAANTVLGSWAESKNDAFVPMGKAAAAGGGGQPVSPSAPGYVEPQPDVFYRLGYAAEALCAGLREQAAELSAGFSASYLRLCGLGAQLDGFGRIAEKERAGQALGAQDFEQIQACLEANECLDQGAFALNPPEPDPLTMIAAVGSSQGQTLQAGLGRLNRIFAAVPLEGGLEIAQGGVYSYYEFRQPQSRPLTIDGWRTLLAVDPPARGYWQNEFWLGGGRAVSALALRLGDIYQLGEKGYGPSLVLRAEPAKSAAALAQVNGGYYLETVAGPVMNYDGEWWKVRVLGENDFPQGWILARKANLARSYK